MNEWVGKTLGRVHIDSLLARGGVAEVYLGTHTLLHRKVAVKILRNQYEDDPNLLERFQREAVVVSRLRHPNIVQILDFDTFEGQPYIVMEYIGGPSLSTYLKVFHGKGRRLELTVISRLMASVAGALDYAHELGVIHRDVKPGNILLTSQTGPVIAGNTMPARFEPVLTDFGLLRFLNSSHQTSIGQIAGTPAYMSPEQALGETTDERTDIYSLGVVLYEMLSGGRVPFDGETTMSILLKHIHEPPAPIHGLARPLQKVLDRALAKNRADRFASPIEFASTFQAATEQRSAADTIMQETPTVARPRIKFKPFRKWSPAIVAGIIALLFGSFLWVNGLQNQRDLFIPETGGTFPSTTTPVNAPSIQLGSTGILRFTNGTAIGDKAILSAQAMPLPLTGSQYQVWLIGGESRQSLGILMLDERGQGELEFTESGGSNLIGMYDKVEVTIEANPDEDPDRPGAVAFSFPMPAEALIHVRYLLSSFPNTPGETPVIQGLYSSIQFIHKSALEMRAAYENGDETVVRQKAEIILNLLAGDQSSEHKDWDGDGELLDPYDGYGLLLNGSHPGYIQSVYSEADYAVNTPGATLKMIRHGEDVKICAQNLAQWAPPLRDIVTTILTSAPGSDLGQLVSDVATFADRMLNGLDLDADQTVEPLSGECGAQTAYEFAYYMADMPLLPVGIISSPDSIEGTITPTPTATRAPIVLSPTKRPSGSQDNPAPTPPKEHPTQKPKPTKKNP